jgi:hypothetical protein
MLPDAFHASNARREIRTEEAGIRRLVRESADRG